MHITQKKEERLNAKNNTRKAEEILWRDLCFVCVRAAHLSPFFAHFRHCVDQTQEGKPFLPRRYGGWKDDDSNKNNSRHTHTQVSFFFLLSSLRVGLLGLAFAALPLLLLAE